MDEDGLRPAAGADLKKRRGLLFGKHKARDLLGRRVGDEELAGLDHMADTPVEEHAPLGEAVASGDVLAVDRHGHRVTVGRHDRLDDLGLVRLGRIDCDEQGCRLVRSREVIARGLGAQVEKRPLGKPLGEGV